MLSFIHTADIHLDAPLVSMGSRYEVRQSDFRLTMQRIRDLVLEKQVDFWLIAGDLLEYHGGRRATAIFLQELFASVSPLPVCIAPGNHDPWMEGSLYQTIEWSSNVLFFTEEWGAYEFPEQSAVVYGWGFPRPHVTESPIPQFPGKLPGYKHHLMVLHGTVLSTDASEHQPYAPMPLGELVGTEMDYIALGHIHKPTQFTHPVRPCPFAAYPGSPEGLTVKESGERHVLYGTMDDAGIVSLEAIPVQSRQIRRIQLESKGVETMEALLARVESGLRKERNDDLIYLTLTGERASHLLPSIELLNDRLNRFFLLHIEDKTRPDVDTEKLLAENSVLGRWIRKLDEAEASAKDEREREVVRLAKEEALRLIGGALR